MNDWPTEVPEVTDLTNNRDIASKKQAACLSCRRSKTKCVRESLGHTCKRCLQNNSECLIPDYHVGRRKGIKNKRSGLDKAVRQIEKAIKTSKNRIVLSDDEQRLHFLLTEAETLVPENPDTSATPSTSEHFDIQSPFKPAFKPQNQPERASPLLMQSSVQIRKDDFALDDAENPLQLLARASDLADSGFDSKLYLNDHRRIASDTATSLSDGQLRPLFGPFRPGLDIGNDIDPVELGLVTSDEMRTLIEYFYTNLAHTRWGMDPSIHTAQFVRSRSAFLLTSMMAASALFIPSAAALSKRLSNHRSHLAHHVTVNRFRSPEIVLAFMVNVPWMSHENHWADDETCLYMAMAHSIALDLSLNKVILSGTDVLATVPKCDSIYARRALDMDGFLDVDVASTWGQKLLRRRERIWLALFNLDRGVCLARGRTFTVQISPLLERCDEWHKSTIADVWDGSIVASCVLRRDVGRLIQAIKEICDADASKEPDGVNTARSLRQMIDNFFDCWYTTWRMEIGREKELRLPPYVEILVSHTRLSIYSQVLNHPTANPETYGYFRSGGLLSALMVMRAAVQGESLLRTMPNNTAIMVSFSACFALHLSLDNASGLSRSIQQLIMETADVLERIGNNTAHRKGNSALYGRHLRQIIRNASTMRISPAGPAIVNQDHQVQGAVQDTQGYSEGYTAFEPLQLSAISEDQLDDLINNSRGNLELKPGDLQLEDTIGMEWLDWFDFYGAV